jgi:hypothetical protein
MTNQQKIIKTKVGILERAKIRCFAPFWGGFGDGRDRP